MFLPLRSIALVAALAAAMPAAARPAHRVLPAGGMDPGERLSDRPSDYSNGYGTNAGNSTSTGGPVGPYGGYVVNEYGFGNYVSGPAGYGGYPAGSAGAQIWRQREQAKCQAIPESC